MRGAPTDSRKRGLRLVVDSNLIELVDARMKLGAPVAVKWHERGLAFIVKETPQAPSSSIRFLIPMTPLLSAERRPIPARSIRSQADEIPCCTVNRQPPSPPPSAP